MFLSVPSVTVCDQMNEFICGNSAKRSDGDSGDLLMGDMGWKLEDNGQ